MLKQVEAAGFIKGFAAGISNVPTLRVTHLLFADDSIIFCGADKLQLAYLRCTLLGFEAVTGLRINLQKSEILPVGITAGLTDLAALLGCSIGSFPTTYLGLPLGGSCKSKLIWEPVMEKCRNRLAKWKLKYLSAGARVTLIKSVLSSLPTYYLSLFKAPVTVIKELEKLERDFLWGRGDDVFKHNLVRWNNVCKPITAGGAGFRQLRLNNEALLGKWLWRYNKEENSLWRKLITVKYGKEAGGCSQSKVSGIWNGIRRLWQPFSICTSWQAGKGDKVSFWNQNWLGVGCFSDLFPELFAIAVKREACVSDYYCTDGTQGSWSPLLRRNVQDWELDSLLKLLEMLSSVQLSEEEDSMVWKHSKNMTFSVKSFYTFLQGNHEDSFPWLNIWKANIPTRVIFFAWCVAKGKILTMDNLQHRGYKLANRCSLCQKNEETIPHLLLHCPWTTEIWNLILSCFGVQLCFSRDIVGFLLLWWAQPLAKRIKSTWDLVPYCIFWLIWKERNRRLFEEEERTGLKIKNAFLSCLYGWAREGSDLDLCSFMNFLDSLR